MDQILFLEKKLVKWERVFEKFPHQYIYNIDNIEERLTGGADNGVNNKLQKDQLCINIMEPDENSELNQYNRQRSILEHEEVDDILKNAIQNIEEASNRLMTLTETHEYELKILFAVILSKLKKFIDVIRERLNTTKTSLNNLQLKLAEKFIELQKKNEELTQIKNELAQCRAECEPQIRTQISTTSTQSINELITYASKEIMAPTNSSQKTTILAVSSSHQMKENKSLSQETVTPHSVITTVEPLIEAITDQNDDLCEQVSTQVISNPSTAPNMNAVENSTHNLSSQLLPKINSTSSLENIVNHRSSNNQPETPEVSSAVKNVYLRRPVTLSIDQVQEASEGLISDIHSAKNITNEIHAIFSLYEKIVNQDHRSPSNSPATKIQVANTEVSSGQSSVFIEKPSSYRRSVSCIESSPPITLETEPVSFPSGKQLIQQQKEIENDQREAHLLENIKEICRENEKLKKDKSEYEQAIQKALFRGILSLNSEAIKILPDLPLICYQPCCIACPYLSSSASTMLSEMINGNKYVQAKSNLSSKGKIQLKNRTKYLECCRSTKMCARSNMIVILPKPNLDNPHVNIPQFHINENNLETKKTVCHNGSCNKEIFKAHYHCDPVIGKEFCKGNFEQYTEAVNYSNIVKSSGINKPHIFQRRTGFTKSK